MITFNIGIAFLSLISGIGYLVVGHLNGTMLTPWLAVLQLFLAVSVIASGIKLKKDKTGQTVFKSRHNGCALAFYGYIAFVVFFGSTG